MKEKFQEIYDRVKKSPYKKTKAVIYVCSIVIAVLFISSLLGWYHAKYTYEEKVCFQSFPGYCEYEMVKEVNGIIYKKPLLNGLMMFQNDSSYSNRRMPQFGFKNYLKISEVRYCRNLTWVNVPCSEPHIYETVISKKASKVYWWNDTIDPDYKWKVINEKW